jgi:HK97 family phage prohead protease
VVFVRNHDPDKVMARTPDTLRLEESERGVRFDADVAPVSYAADMLVSLSRGDLKHASFRYRANPKDVTWREMNGRLERTVEKADGLRDITVATFPAYKQTKVAIMRSLFDAERCVMGDDIVRALAHAVGEQVSGIQVEQAALGAGQGAAGQAETEGLRRKCEGLEVERGAWRARMADMQREIDALARMRAWLLARA